ncbi:hypothetical protein [Streptomyces sp. NBC_00474]|uniref:hypothetical protein n=1 Tax=Streptomyces sp. NBC_00474 TaxID=2975754 RepID=UPI00225657B2|nr:hypothetical protein [Streptomyces sp. NBC_00474]MCX5051044.1 hypothetical protein [Streptomyces sp. NBC_00474]
MAVLNPYWGDVGANFAWNNASYPPHGVESFGIDGSLDVGSLLGELSAINGVRQNQVLTSLAREAPSDAVDLLWMIASSRASDQEAETLASMGIEAAALAERAASGLAPDWPADAVDDEEFLSRLLSALPAGRAMGTPLNEAFGGHQGGRRMAVLRLREALGRMTAAVPRAGSSALRHVARRPVHTTGTRFIGDVLAYFRQREEQGHQAPIAQRVASSLAEALRLRTPADPRLVVIAHSMGGNIVYDLLSYLRPELECDVLVTVGSQVGLMAELGLFPAVPAPEDPARDRAPVPEGVRHWINIFDPNDPLSFVVGSIFASGRDFSYSTGRGLMAAHGSYFRMPSFYRRLAERLVVTLNAESHG